MQVAAKDSLLVKVAGGYCGSTNLGKANGIRILLQ